MKNGPRVWAFCKIEFPGIQKPVQILTQKSCFFRNPGNRGVGVIWLVRGVVLGLFVVLLCEWFSFRLCCGVIAVLPWSGFGRYLFCWVGFVRQ